MLNLMQLTVMFVGTFAGLLPFVLGEGEQCGPLAGGARCAVQGACCSSWGFCGNTEFHCLTGCDTAYGVCGLAAITSMDSGVAAPSTAESPQAVLSPGEITACGPASGGNSCSDGMCCSRWGWCGTSSAYCSVQECLVGYGACDATAESQPTPTPLPLSEYECGINNGRSCPSGCCSAYGWCGATALHCGVGCQAAYGICDDAHTKGVRRLQEANVETTDEIQGCALTSWSEWSECLAGVQMRTRAIVGQSVCEDQRLTESRPCDCRYSDWSQWSQCSLPCGGGTSMRSRDFLAGGQPEACATAFAVEEHQSCNQQACAAQTNKLRGSVTLYT